MFTCLPLCHCWFCHVNTQEKAACQTVRVQEQIKVVQIIKADAETTCLRSLCNGNITHRLHLAGQGCASAFPSRVIHSQSDLRWCQHSCIASTPCATCSANRMPNRVLRTADARRHAHARTHTIAHTQSHTDKQTQTNTHTHTHTHAQTETN